MTFSALSCSFVVLMLSAQGPVVASQQAPAAKTLAALNALLATQGMTADVLELSPDGMMTRTLSDGRSMRFRLKDVATFDVDYDGLIGNVLLRCGADRSCVESRESKTASWAQSRMTVISFKPDANVEEAIRLFKQLQAELAKQPA